MVLGFGFWVLGTPGDRSCGGRIQEAKRNVHKRVRWLNKQIDTETEEISKLFNLDFLKTGNWVEDLVEHDKAAEHSREKAHDEQDRRQHEDLRNSNIGVAASKRGREICDMEHQRFYGKRQAPCTPPERGGDAVSKAELLDDLDGFFGEVGTETAVAASGDTQLLEDELRKAVDEQFMLASQSSAG